MDKLFRLMPVLVPVALVVALSFPLLALGVRYGLWGFQIALSLLAGAALTAAILLALAGVGLLSALRRQQRRAATQGMLVILFLVAPVAMVFHFGLKASQVPVLYDISTTWVNPPPISAARPEGANPLQSADTNQALQKEFYPDVVTLTVAASPSEVLQRIEQVAQELGWEVTSVDGNTGIVEATDTSFWFGFVDDVTVRARATTEGTTVIDVRSVSRVGKSDLGKNAERIRSFITAFGI